MTNRTKSNLAAIAYQHDHDYRIVQWRLIDTQVNEMNSNSKIKLNRDSLT